MLREIISMLTSRLLWGLAGITSLSGIIWAFGPRLVISGTHPLASSEIRVGVISGLYIIWSFRYIIPRLYWWWKRNKSNRRLQSQKLQEHTEDNNYSLNSEDILLAERFEKTAKILKRAYINKNQNRRFNWIYKFNKNYIYDLPWFVLLGGPGSGKSSVLANSGLPFPLSDSFSQIVKQEISGTRTCDWAFANDAVILDTAGRFTLQDGNHDNKTWKNFMLLLRKYRYRQPINGLILMVDIQTLISNNSETLYQHAINARRRLAELRDNLKIEFPVYVQVTKLDLLRGFKEYFADIDKINREQIWGFTFSLEESKQPGFNLIERCSEEYSLLQQRINYALPGTMLKDRIAKSRDEAYMFPQEFSALYPYLIDYLSLVFSYSDFETSFTPRGIYFTSSKQTEDSVDIVSDVSGGLLSDNNLWDSQQTVTREVGEGKGYFIKNFLEEVVFREAGIAGLHRWWLIRSRLINWIGYTLLIAVAIIVTGFWLNSYDENKSYLVDEVGNKLPGIELLAKNLNLTTEKRDIYEVLPLLNDLLALPKSANFDVLSPPLSKQMGLYRGRDAINATNVTYNKALQQTFLPEVSLYITDWLRNDTGSDAEYSYESLMAYQMLYDEGKYDGKFLSKWVIFNLNKNLPQNITKDQLKQLSQHVHNLFESKTQRSPFTKDVNLIRRQQALILQRPISERIYGRMRRLLINNDDLKPVSIITLGGPQSELIFVRKSRTPLSEGVPGLYTHQGYWNYFDKKIGSTINSLQESDAWVLGNHSEIKNDHLLNIAVRQLYMTDFISHWDDLLHDIQLNNGTNLSQRINITRLISGSNSPLRRFIINLGKTVTLAEPSEDQDNDSDVPSEENNNILESIFSRGENVPAGMAVINKSPEQQVNDHYAGLIELGKPLNKSSKTIGFDDFLKQVNDLYYYLIAVQDAAKSGMSPPSGDVIDRIKASAGQLPDELREIFTHMVTGASSDVHLRDLDTVRQRLGVEIGEFCHQAISGRYPFAHSSRRDVTSDDLSRMFAPGSGMMDSFFRNYLANKVDTTRSNWRFISGVDGKTLSGSDKVLKPFQQAQIIRDAFFTNGTAAPSYKVSVRTVSLDKNVLNMTLDVDGQLMQYSHGPQTTKIFNWPGHGGTNEVRLELTLVNGRSAILTTSGAWAINRFFDKANITKGHNDLSRLATFDVDGYKVVMEFIPNSIRNPFFMPKFSCPQH